MNKKQYGLYLFLIAFFALNNRADDATSLVVDISSSVKNGHSDQRMPLFIGAVGATKERHDYRTMIACLKKDLEMSSQFVVTVEEVDQPKTKKEMKVLFDRGFPLAFFVAPAADGFVWRLYDATNLEMVKGRHYHKRGTEASWWAHQIADELWPELLGQSSSFASKIAFVKKVKVAKNKYTCSICATDLAGNGRQEIVERPSIIISPAWHNDRHTPRLFFSEFTLKNVRVMGCDVAAACQKGAGLRKVLDMDGTCAGISYARSGSDVVYCRSGEIWRHHFNSDVGQSVHTRIIVEKKPCSSPCLLASGDVVYASGGAIKIYTAATQEKRVLVNDGFCVSPTVCEEVGLVAYAKKVKGVFQLFSCDTNGLRPRQITSGCADKSDPTWSPCGQWLAFCNQDTKSCRIAVVHRATGRSFFLTDEREECAYPAWSYPLDFWPN